MLLEDFLPKGFADFLLRYQSRKEYKLLIFFKSFAIIYLVVEMLPSKMENCDLNVSRAQSCKVKRDINEHEGCLENICSLVLDIPPIPSRCQEIYEAYLCLYCDQSRVSDPPYFEADPDPDPDPT